MQTRLITSRPGKQLIIHIYVSFECCAYEAQPPHKVPCREKVLIITVSAVQSELPCITVYFGGGVKWSKKPPVSVCNHLLSSLLRKKIGTRISPKNCETQMCLIK